jgi:Protein of unknown function (DUF3489)
VLALLRGPNGATIATVMRTTGWQPHTVRGFLTAVVRKKLGLRLESEKTDGERVYRLLPARIPPMPPVCRVRSHAADVRRTMTYAPLFALAEQRPRRGVMAQASTLDNVHIEGV